MLAPLSTQSLVSGTVAPHMGADVAKPAADRAAPLPLDDRIDHPGLRRAPHLQLRLPLPAMAQHPADDRPQADVIPSPGQVVGGVGLPVLPGRGAVEVPLLAIDLTQPALDRMSPQLDALHGPGAPGEQVRLVGRHLLVYTLSCHACSFCLMISSNGTDTKAVFRRFFLSLARRSVTRMPSFFPISLITTSPPRVLIASSICPAWTSRRETLSTPVRKLCIVAGIGLLLCPILPGRRLRHRLLDESLQGLLGAPRRARLRVVVRRVAVGRQLLLDLHAERRHLGVQLIAEPQLLVHTRLQLRRDRLIGLPIVALERPLLPI